MKIPQTTYKLFLDDERIPFTVWGYTRNQMFLTTDWIIVRTYEQFTAHILTNWNEKQAWPEIIAFDHDLADEHNKHNGADEIPYDQFVEKTGMEAAKWLVEFCMDYDMPLPKYFVHSMNEVGQENIYKYLSNYKRFKENNP